MMAVTTSLTYTVVLVPDPEGGFCVSVPALPGCHTQGETEEEALEMAEDAIRCYVESLRLDGLPLPKEEAHPFTTLVRVSLGSDT
jgi:antitoxin HicB